MADTGPGRWGLRLPAGGCGEVVEDFELRMLLAGESSFGLLLHESLLSRRDGGGEAVVVVALPQ